MTRTYQTLKGTNERIDEMNARFEEALATIEAIKAELDAKTVVEEVNPPLKHVDMRTHLRNVLWGGLLAMFATGSICLLLLFR